MKQLIIIALILLSVVSVYSQRQDILYPDVSYGRTLTAGTTMSARTAATTLDDTTRGFNTRGYAKVYIGLELAANDSANPLFVAYQVSKNGSTWSALTVLDSANFVGTVGDSKYFELPANAMGAYQARVRVYGRVGGGYSAGPVTTVATKIIRIPYGNQKVR